MLAFLDMIGADELDLNLKKTVVSRWSAKSSAFLSRRGPDIGMLQSLE